MKKHAKLFRSAALSGWILSAAAALAMGADVANPLAVDAAVVRGGALPAPVAAPVFRGGASYGRSYAPPVSRGSEPVSGGYGRHVDFSPSYGSFYRADDPAYYRATEESRIHVPGRIVNAPISNGVPQNNNNNNNNNNWNNLWPILDYYYGWGWPYYGYGTPVGYSYPAGGDYSPDVNPPQQQPPPQQPQAQQPPAIMPRQQMADAQQSMDDIRAQMWRQFEQSPQYIAAAAEVNRAEFAYAMAVADARSHVADSPDYQQALNKKYAAEDEVRALNLGTQPPPMSRIAAAATEKLQASRTLERLYNDAQLHDPKVAQAEQTLNTARDHLNAVTGDFDHSVKDDSAWQAAKRQYDTARSAMQ